MNECTLMDGWMDGWMGGMKKDANYVWPLEPFKKSKEMKRCAYLVF